MSIKDHIFSYKRELENRYQEAKELLTSDEKLTEFLEKVEDKLNKVPFIGEELSNVVVIVEILKDYVQKKYTEIPVASLVAMVAALIYFLTPIDLVLDSIPLLGFVDDLSVIKIALELVNQDVEKYKQWKKNEVQVKEE